MNRMTGSINQMLRCEVPYFEFLSFRTAAICSCSVMAVAFLKSNAHVPSRVVNTSNDESFDHSKFSFKLTAGSPVYLRANTFDVVHSEPDLTSSCAGWW